MAFSFLSFVYFIGQDSKFQTTLVIGGKVIKVKKIKILLYTLMGFLTGISSIVMVALSGVGNSYHGANLVLPVLAAIFLGGMSLEGGKGSIWKTVLGVIIISMIFNGLSLMNIKFFYIQIFQGLALIIIVGLYEVRIKKT